MDVRELRLTHADSFLTDQGFVLDFIRFDAHMKRGGSLSENSYLLQLDEPVWSAAPINVGDFVFVDGAEWGGPVEVVRHRSRQRTVTIEGPTWRGLLRQRVLVPPDGQTHLTLPMIDANAAIATLIGDAFAGTISVSSNPVGVQVEGQFRFDTLLAGLERMLRAYGLRLAINFDSGVKRAVVQALPITDYSDRIELSQDYGIDTHTVLGRMDAYNHVVALGSGELLDRMVAHLYRDRDGNITDYMPDDWDPIRERSVVYDYSNAETMADLIAGATQRLREYGNDRMLEINTAKAGIDLQMGDLVAARDRVTGLEGTVEVSEIQLKSGPAGTEIITRVG